MKESHPKSEIGKGAAIYRRLAKDHLGWRLLVGLLCVVCLALFLHFREVRLEVLELNTTATRYVVAQVDFEFPDYETTVILKQQAMQDVGLIYRIDPGEIQKARHELENSMVRSRDWRKAVPSSTFEEIYTALDRMETLLGDARFTDPRTIQVVKNLSLLDISFYEILAEKDGQVYLPEEVWVQIAGAISGDATAFQAVDYVVDAFKSRKWDLQTDEPLERMLRSAVSQTVPDKYTRVQAGARLIEPGEKITSRHLTMMQAMKSAISDSRKLWEPKTLIASLLLSIIFVTISALYFRISQPEFLRSLQKISLFVCIVLLTLLFAKLTEYILLKSDSAFIERIRYPVVAPFASILICILLSPRIALFAAAFLSIILTVSLAVDHSRFLILNLITSILVIIFTQNIRKRKQIFGICWKAFLGSIPVLYAYVLGENQLWNFSLLIDIAASFCFLTTTAILVVGLLPALETVFRILTDMTLMEYMDPENELVQKLAMEVPGTYQHCLVLANLAEACAQAIGANGLLCRVATLYHDIGKILNPQFYTENQQGTTVNLHQLLTPLESAQLIISHVTDGEDLAHKYRLPQPFIDIILQHHGTTLVYYFYRKQLELKGGKAEEVDPNQFRYPGPKPQTREAAIIMICDSVEATSRSIEDASESGITEMINRIVSEKAEDGQFDECPLTFQELSIVKRTLAKSLLMSHHIRIKYPKKEQ